MANQSSCRTCRAELVLQDFVSQERVSCCLDRFRSEIACSVEDASLLLCELSQLTVLRGSEWADISLGGLGATATVSFTARVGLASLPSFGYLSSTRTFSFILPSGLSSRPRLAFNMATPNHEYRRNPISEDNKASYNGTLVGDEDNRDVEKGPRNELKPQYTSHSDDPFGDESNAEVKYKVLEWWYVSPACFTSCLSRHEKEWPKYTRARP